MVREARLDAGETPDSRRPPPRPHRRQRSPPCLTSRRSFLGNWWWTAEASSYSRYVYKPLEATPTVTPDGRLALELRDPGWIATRRLDDFVTDHGHLMHLFVVSPALDRLWHLHPARNDDRHVRTAAAGHAGRALRAVRRSRARDRRVGNGGRARCRRRHSGRAADRRRQRVRGRVGSPTEGDDASSGSATRRRSCRSG